MKQRDLQFLFTSRVGYFLRCAECQSLTEAAARIGVTQAALSHAIKQLETQVGERLLERRSHGIALTAKGRALLDIVAQHQRRMALDLADAWSGDGGIKVRVGSVMHFGIHTLVPL